MALVADLRDFVHNSYIRDLQFIYILGGIGCFSRYFNIAGRYKKKVLSWLLTRQTK